MKRILLVLFILIPLSMIHLKAQSLKAGIGGGLNMFTGPDAFTGDAPNGMAFNTEYAVGLKAKFGIPLLPLSITGQALYTSLNSKTSFTQGGSTYNLDYSSSIFTVALGAELSFIPGPVSPYAGVDVMMNSFGDTEVEPQVISGVQYVHKSASYSRFGLGVGAGVEIKLLPMVDIDVSAKYNFNNLIGKETGEGDINSVLVTAHILFGIL